MNSGSAEVVPLVASEKKVEACVVSSLFERVYAELPLSHFGSAESGGESVRTCACASRDRIPAERTLCGVDVLTRNNVTVSGLPDGFEGINRTMLWLSRVFSDQRWEIHQVLGDGDLVAPRVERPHPAANLLAQFWESTG